MSYQKQYKQEESGLISKENNQPRILYPTKKIFKNQSGFKKKKKRLNCFVLFFIKKLKQQTYNTKKVIIDPLHEKENTRCKYESI